MEFKKNKFKVIQFYIVALVVISVVLWALLSLLIDSRNIVIMFFAFGELVLFASIIMNKNAIVGELCQSITLNEKNVKCKNFFVAGSLANATFEYNQIKSIQMRRTLFSRCLVIKVKGSENIPVVLNNQFKDYMKLWRTVCDGCKSQNSDTYIDSKTYDYLYKCSQTGNGSMIDK